MLPLLSEEHKVTESVFQAAHCFFERREEEKAPFSLSGQLNGWRDLGAEFSGSPDRPDLNEAFGLVDRSRASMAALGWIESNPLHRALLDALTLIKPMVDSLLEELRLVLAPDGDRLLASDWSYLQVNYYRPADESRTFLQDAHEDGHLITVLSANQPGLEIEVEGKFQPAPCDGSSLLVMPGSILTRMTGGLIAPLRHRVRRLAETKSRLSLMYFVNPSLDTPPSAWLADANGNRADIREAVIATSTAFGLPALDRAVNVSEVP